MDERERQARRDAFLKQVNASVRVFENKPQESELVESSSKVLVKAALELGVPLLRVYGDLGLHPSEGKAALDDLLARGMVRVHRVVRKGRGGQPQVLEVLQPGRDELAKRGITPTEKKIKRGGFLHDVYARHLEKWAKAQGFPFWFERTLGQKAFDFVYQDRQGDLMAIEICLSGSAQWNASQAIKGAGVQGIKKIVLACERKEFMKAIFKEIQEIDGLGLYSKRLVGKLLSEFVE